MSIWRSKTKKDCSDKASKGDSEKRSRPRFNCRCVRCGEGFILDAAAGGLRVLFPKRPPPVDEIFTITICPVMQVGGDKSEAEAEVRVVWLKRCGLSRWIVGLSFEDDDAAIKMNLFRLAWDPLAESVLKAS